MEHQDLMLTFAEVAVAFAGFSAVVSMFDRRSEHDDPRVRHYRVRVMVEYGVCVSIFAFVPYLLDALLGSPELAWRLASGLLVCVWSFIGLSAQHRSKRIFERSTFAVAPAFAFASAAIGYIGAAILVLNVFGRPIRSAGASYAVGLFFPLLQTALYFLRIVVHGDPIRRT